MATGHPTLGNFHPQAPKLVALPTIQPRQGIPFWGDLSLKYIGIGTGFISPPSLWDIIFFGPNNTPLPGLARVKRCQRKMKLHRKDHPATDYETQTFQGYSVVEFDFELEIWTQPQLANLQSALAYLFPGAGDPPDPTSSVSVATVASSANIVNPSSNSSQGIQGLQQIQTTSNTPKKAPIPVKLWHPALQMHGVDTVVFYDMDGPIQKSPAIPDIFVVHFKTVQFRPSKAVQHNTFNAVSNGLPTPLGDTGPVGLGVLQPQYIPPQQQPNQAPSVSGGAAPFGSPSTANLLNGGGT